MTRPDHTQLIDLIPDPDTVRDHLAYLARERALLRELLKLAQHKQRDRERRQEVCHADR